MSYARNLARIARKGVISVDTAAELRSLTPYNGFWPQEVLTKGALAVGDKGGGSWVPDTTSVKVDNLGTVLDGQLGIKWLRKISDKVPVEAFGVDTSGNGDQRLAFQAALDAGVPLTVAKSGAVIRTEGSIYVPAKTSFAGNSCLIWHDGDNTPNTSLNSTLFFGNYHPNYWTRRGLVFTDADDVIRSGQRSLTFPSGHSFVVGDVLLIIGGGFQAYGNYDIHRLIMLNRVLEVGGNTCWLEFPIPMSASGVKALDANGTGYADVDYGRTLYVCSDTVFVDTSLKSTHNNVMARGGALGSRIELVGAEGRSSFFTNLFCACTVNIVYASTWGKTVEFAGGSTGTNVNIGVLSYSRNSDSDNQRMVNFTESSVGNSLVINELYANNWNWPAQNLIGFNGASNNKIKINSLSAPMITGRLFSCVASSEADIPTNDNSLDIDTVEVGPNIERLWFDGADAGEISGNRMHIGLLRHSGTSASPLSIQGDKSIIDINNMPEGVSTVGSKVLTGVLIGHYPELNNVWWGIIRDWDTSRATFGYQRDLSKAQARAGVTTVTSATPVDVVTTGKLAKDLVDFGGLGLPTFTIEVIGETLPSGGVLTLNDANGTVRAVTLTGPGGFCVRFLIMPTGLARAEVSITVAHASSFVAYYDTRTGLPDMRGPWTVTATSDGTNQFSVRAASIKAHDPVFE